MEVRNISINFKSIPVIGAFGNYTANINIIKKGKIAFFINLVYYIAGK